jgi:rhodanese-related sulfurtransferase
MIKKIDLKSLKDKIEKKQVNLIDVLDKDSYEKVHIKGAINIPFLKMDEDAVKKQIDPEKEIVVYSIDYDCPVSKIAAGKLKKFGYKNVFYYHGGKQEWLEAGLPVVKPGH